VGVPSTPSSPQVGKQSSRVIQKILAIHEDLAFPSDLLIHPELYNDTFCEGYLVRLHQELGGEESGKQEREIVLRLPPPPQGPLNFQVGPLTQQRTSH
jgi:hypothetical protein